MDVQNTVLTLTPQTVYDKTNQQNITGTAACYQQAVQTLPLSNHVQP